MCEMYLTQVLKYGTKCKTMNELRSWAYHHKKSLTLEQLPPTSYSIRDHILRSIYATHNMVSILDNQRVVLDPRNYGFCEENDLLLPTNSVKTIPEMYAQFCNCVKCATIKCSCRRIGVPCCKF